MADDCKGGNCDLKRKNSYKLVMDVDGTLTYGKMLYILEMISMICHVWKGLD